MNFCPKCGKALEEKEKFCSKCGTPAVQQNPTAEVDARQTDVGNVANTQNTVKNAGTPAGSGYSVSNQGYSLYNERFPVKLTDGEEIIKNYEVAKALILPLKGYLAVTNKRIILYSKGMATKFVQETSVSDVGTIHQSMGLCFKPKMLLTGLILIAIGIAVGSIEFLEMGALTGLLVFAGIVCGFFSVKHTNVISVKTGKAAGNGVEFGETSDSANTFSIICSRRGTDSDLLMNEFGSLIMDLQTLGDNAISKWK